MESRRIKSRHLNELHECRSGYLVDARVHKVLEDLIRDWRRRLILRLFAFFLVLMLISIRSFPGTDILALILGFITGVAFGTVMSLILVKKLKKKVVGNYCYADQASNRGRLIWGSIFVLVIAFFPNPLFFISGMFKDFILVFVVFFGPCIPLMPVENQLRYEYALVPAHPHSMPSH